MLANLAWKVFGSLFACAALSMGTLHTVVRLAHEKEQIVRTFEHADQLDTLIVDVNDGHVEIVGRDTDTIRLTGTIDHGLVRTRHTEAVDGDHVVINTHCNHFLSDFCGVDYTLEIPSDLDVIVRNSNGSSMVEGVDGDIDASTDNGSVEVDGARGALRLDSANGFVRATDVASRSVEASTDNGSVHLFFIEPPDSVRADSDNGSVEVVLPDLPDIAYRVETDTDNGSETNSVRTDPSSTRLIVATTDNGSVTVRY